MQCWIGNRTSNVYSTQSKNDDASGLKGLPITSQLAINKGFGNVMSAGIVSQQVILKNSA